MNQSSAIQITTAMDTNLAPATSVETVATENANANASTSVIVTKINSFMSEVVNKPFVSINGLRAIALEECNFGSAGMGIQMLYDNYGIQALNAVLKTALGSKAEIITEPDDDDDDLVVALKIQLKLDDVFKFVELYKLMNA